jgi:hypothetical protein
MELPVTEPAQTTIEEPEGSLEALSRASSVEEIRAVASSHPACLTAWAELGRAAMTAADPVAGYAYFRVGYHRGLDRIRQAGWRGAGQVPWAHEPNRGFLRCLKGLGVAAGRLGEEDEAKRCADFFDQLAPDAPEVT